MPNYKWSEADLGKWTDELGINGAALARVLKLSIPPLASLPQGATLADIVQGACISLPAWMGRGSCGEGSAKSCSPAPAAGRVC